MHVIWKSFCPGFASNYSHLKADYSKWCNKHFMKLKGFALSTCNDNQRHSRTQYKNGRKNLMLTISAPGHLSLKILSVASPEAVFSTLTLSLFGVCVASACRFAAAPLLRHCWTLSDFLRGAKSSSLFMIRPVYVWNFTTCVRVLVGQRDKRLPGCADKIDRLLKHSSQANHFIIWIQSHLNRWPT